MRCELINPCGAESLVEGGAFTSTGWTALGVLVAVLAILAAIAIAWFQRRGQLRDQQAVKANGNGASARHYREIGELLDTGAQLAWKVQRLGPYTAEGLTKLGVEDFNLRLERLARNGPEPLRADLREIVAKTVELRLHILPAAVDQPGSSEWATDDVRAACGTAVAQDRAAQSLEAAINQALERL